ncbi:MAG: hypothetical protein K2Y42_06700 [Hyphomicrobium sp.]|jgi:hypothetical protein|uniref:hypothetical protein n=1 Tax=Hyphomicrobium sp. TaxID=82 RepID=UPI0025C4AC51|nr:hypothetical protein [Hyphomicrobium sp.]MBX9862427.1 hypothetical protein [Hyphomicrobium sp.]
MSNIERINTLEQQLISLGPETHKQKAEILPALTKQCRAFREASRHQEADQVADQIEAINARIKNNEKQLKAIEDELYLLRARETRRKLKPQP